MRAADAAACAASPADEARADEAMILETVRAMYRALVSDDLSLFRSAVTKDFFAYDGGKRFDGDALSSQIKSAHGAGATYVWTVNEPEVHVSCGTAWISYVNRGSRTNASGTTPIVWLESAVLRQDSGQWRIRFFHSTRVP